MNVARAIRRHRKKAGLTQAAFAALLGAQRGWVNQLESETRPPPTLRTLCAVAKVLGITASQLLRDAERYRS